MKFNVTKRSLLIQTKKYNDKKKLRLWLTLFK